MAMLRLPTCASRGRANLHQGAVGVGVDIATGRTLSAMWHDRFVALHPDTQEPLVGVAIPHWQEVLRIASRLSEALGLGYVGVDVVLDAQVGPIVLEANARPGLSIQIANGCGLLPRLQEQVARSGAPAVPAGERRRMMVKV
jgi:alpha-L-glutamate ligase-like protein